VLPDASRIDLLEPADFRTYLARPESLRELVAAEAPDSTVVIDEIQRVPQLLPVVHALIEDYRSVRFVLTGSSARKLRREGVDLLGGRAVLRHMHPFMAAELGDHFTLDPALQYGMVPLVRTADSPHETLEAYVGLYLEQEVRAEAAVRRVDDFVRFLESAAFSQGNVLNAAHIARESEVSRSTVVSYLTIAEELLILFRLPVFARRARRAMVAHEKVYFFDCGVYRSLRRTGPLDQPGDIAGPALETLVAQHLRAWIDYATSSVRLYYWRTRAGNEVDFVLYGDTTFVAIEVKNSSRVRPEDLRGLRSFGEDYPEARRILLYRGTQRRLVDGVLCMPVDGFLRGLRPDSDVPA